MKLTNKHGVPKTIAETIAAGIWRPKAESLGVTTLIGPPLPRHLKLTKWDDIECDVSNFIYRILGTGTHSTLENNPNVISEKRVEWQFAEIKLVGVIDAIRDNTIEDNKVTSVWAAMKGVKPEWEAQLNCYNRLYFKTKANSDADITKLQINLVFRDWSQTQAYREHDYPKIMSVVQNVKLWPVEQAEKFIKDRIKDHLENPDRQCTSEEKWEKPTMYAVKKQGGKRALRVLETESEAIVWMKRQQAQTGFFIETRPGECTRCKSYCDVSGVCPYV